MQTWWKLSCEIPRVGLSIFSGMAGLRAAHGIGPRKNREKEMRRNKSSMGLQSEVPDMADHQVSLMGPKDKIFLCFYHLVHKWLSSFLKFQMAASKIPKERQVQARVKELFDELWDSMI